MVQKVLIRGLYGLVLLLCVLTTAGLSALLETKQFVFKKVAAPQEEIATTPFPVSVDPEARTITTEDLLQNYVYDTFAARETPTLWRDQVLAFFTQKDWYQNLASPVSRILIIWPGERKEEIAKHIGDILRWSPEERATFLHTIAAADPVMSEGKFYPGQYVVHKHATPAEVASLIEEKFAADILSRYTSEVAAKVPLEDALIIASLLEREASDFQNMREVSGVVWNRIFADMPLQLDATLQYIRGSKVTEKNWWPAPRPADKYLSSPYNTYLNKGLPPAPIANPSVASIIAALNPVPTECVYYFHDDDGGYHCSQTYDEHVSRLKAIYGRGR